MAGKGRGIPQKSNDDEWDEEIAPPKGKELRRSPPRKLQLPSESSSSSAEEEEGVQEVTEGAAASAVPTPVMTRSKAKKAEPTPSRKKMADAHFGRLANEINGIKSFLSSDLAKLIKDQMESIKEQFDQSIKQSMKDQIEQSIKQAMKDQIDQSIKQSLDVINAKLDDHAHRLQDMTESQSDIVKDIDVITGNTERLSSSIAKHAERVKKLESKRTEVQPNRSPSSIDIHDQETDAEEALGATESSRTSFNNGEETNPTNKQSNQVNVETAPALATKLNDEESNQNQAGGGGFRFTYIDMDGTCYHYRTLKDMNLAVDPIAVEKFAVPDSRSKQTNPIRIKSTGTASAAPKSSTIPWANLNEIDESGIGSNWTSLGQTKSVAKKPEDSSSGKPTSISRADKDHVSISSATTDSGQAANSAQPPQASAMNQALSKTGQIQPDDSVRNRRQLADEILEDRQRYQVEIHRLLREINRAMEANDRPLARQHLQVIFKQKKRHVDTEVELKPLLSRQELRDQQTLEDEIERKVEEARHKVEADSHLKRGKLPVNQYRHFSGNLMEFELFWNNFQTIHLDDGLTEDVKLSHLKAHLHGEASELVQNFFYTKEGYQQAVKRLEDTYGKPERQKLGRIQALQQLPAYKTTNFSSGCKTLLQEIEVHTTSLIKMGVEKNIVESIVETRLLSTCIPQEVQKLWLREKGNLKYKALLECIAREVDEDAQVRANQTAYVKPSRKAGDPPGDDGLPFNMVAAAVPAGTTAVGQPGRNPNKAQTPKKEQTAPTSDAARKGNKPKNKQKKPTCLLCKGEHKTSNCSVGSVQDRVKLVTDLKLCKICLRSGHIPIGCTSGYECPNCKKDSHHAILCYKGNADKGKTISTAVAANSSSNRELILLPNFTVEDEDKKVKMLGFLDTGSHRSYIKISTAQKLGLKPHGVEECSINTFGSLRGENVSLPKYQWTIDCPAYQGKTITLNFLGQEKLVSAQPYAETPFSIILEAEEQLLADRRHYSGRGYPDDYDILIGNDHYWSIMSRRLRRGENNLVAIFSVFGWILNGLSNTSLTQPITVAPVVSRPSQLQETDEEDRILYLDFRDFWRLDHLGITDPELPDTVFIKQYTDQITRQPDGRYVAPLPWKNPLDNRRPHTKALTIKRTLEEWKRLRRKGKAQGYWDIFQEWIALGFIKKADKSYAKPVTYLPNRGVERDDAPTTKCRPVFDGSAHLKGQPSINDMLEVGPNLNPEIMEVLLRFRLHKIAWTADITKAFLQIKLAPEDQETIRFFVPEDPNKSDTELEEYSWSVVPFGLTSSPFILRAVMLKHFESYDSKYPDTIQLLRDQLYVDDWIAGSDSVETAVKRITEAIEIFKAAKMDLMKWTTNSRQLRIALDGTVQFEDTPVSVGANTMGPTSVKTLGILWNQDTDEFSFRTETILRQAESYGPVPTKRQICSPTCKIYDPLGLVAPVTLPGKLLMQETWELKIDWDDKVTPELASYWSIFLDGIRHLSKLKFTRWSGINPAEPFEIDVFCDASEDAYGAVIYARQKRADDSYWTHLLASKTRVSQKPKKTMTIPRLELLSNVLASNLGRYVSNAFHRCSTKLRCWTDSMIALHWIVTAPERWKTFIRNRVEQIRTVFDPKQVRHCRGIENPADIASRGASSTSLGDAIGWWTGPSWLRKDSTDWPEQPDTITAAIQKEIDNEAIKVINISTVVTMNPLYRDYSDIKRVCRLAGLLLRFKNAWTLAHARRKPTHRDQAQLIPHPSEPTMLFSRELSAEELRLARIALVRWAQRESFSDDFERLSTGKTANKKTMKQSPIGDLNTVWDPEDSVIRVQGRLKHAFEALGKKAPLLLPRQHHLTSLIIRECHEDNKHTGVDTVMSILRREYWIPKARTVIRSLLGRCVRCNRIQSHAFDAIPAQLPVERCMKTNPFQHVGIDYAGPFKVTIPIEGMFLDVKVYVVVFTCAVIRAVHLEVVPDQRGDTFIYAFRKFCARRGVPAVIFSDNGAQFSYAAKLLGMLYHDKRVSDYLANHNVTWKFSVSLAPWWGGFWERMVQTMKRMFYKTVGTRILDNYLFETLITEIEGIINDRPLTYHTEMSKLITPSMLLTGRLIDGPSQTQKRSVQDVPTSTATDMHEYDAQRRTLLQEWWDIWQDDYLTSLIQKDAKSYAKVKPMEVGQVVLVHEDNVPRYKWQTARITEVHKSETDGHIRAATLVKNNQTITRPAQQLYPLEAHAGQIDRECIIACCVRPDGYTPRQSWKDRKNPEDSSPGSVRNTDPDCQ